MRNLFLIFAFTTLVSCSNNKHQNEVKKQLESIENWDLIEFKESKVDTNKINILNSPKFYAKLKNKSIDSCLIPKLNFYPLKLKDSINDLLNRHLILRSTFFPAPPKKYITDDYFILIWNFIDYFNKNCCDCENLEKILKEKLEMTFYLHENNLPVFLNNNQNE